MLRFYILTLLVFCLNIKSNGQAGVPWKKLTQSISSNESFKIIEIIDDSSFFVASDSLILFSSNQGLSFKKILSPTKNIGSFSFCDSLNGVVTNTITNRIYVTDNGGLTWNLVPVVVGSFGAYNAQILKNKTIMVSDAEKLYSVKDVGLTVNNVFNNGTNFSFYFVNDLVGYKINAWSYQTFKTINGGYTWVMQSNSGMYLFQNGKLNFKDENEGVYSTSNLFYTKNAGLTWEPKFGTSISSSFRKENIYAISTQNKLYLISKNQSSSQLIPLGNNVNVVNFRNDSIGYVCGSNGYIARYKNHMDTCYIDNNQLRYDVEVSSNSLVINTGKSVLKYSKLKAIENNVGSFITIENTDLLITDGIKNNGNILVKKGASLLFTTNVIGNKLDQELEFLPFGKIRIGDTLKLETKAGSGQKSFYSIQGSSVSWYNNTLPSIEAKSIGKSIITAQHLGDINWNPSPIEKQEIEVLPSSSSLYGNYNIYNWFENKKSATVLTYDDWSPGQYEVAYAEHVKRGIKGTFYVTTSNAWRTDDYIRMDKLASLGNEIGNHTATHPHLNAITGAALTTQITNTKAFLDLKVGSQPHLVKTFCYPYGDYNDQVIDTVMKQHIAARAITEAVSYPYQFAQTERDYYKVETNEVNAAIGVQGFCNSLNTAIADGGLATFMIHSIGPTDTWFDQISTAQYNEMLDSLEGKSETTWITTFYNAIRYHKERNSATMTKKSENFDSLVLVLSDTLSDNTIYSHPLSIYFNFPQNIRIDSICQNHKLVAFQQSNGLLTFNAVPDLGDIIIYRQIPNHAPTDLILSTSIVDENVSSGQLIAVLTTVDQDSGESFNYSFSSGLGSDDNNKFLLIGDQLKIINSPNYELMSSYSIRVKTTDLKGNYFEKAFQITVNNVNENTLDINISNSNVAENNVLNSLVGTLYTVDDDLNDTYIYTLVNGSGSSDNNKFQVLGDQLILTNSSDFELQSIYYIRIKTEDQGGNTLEKSFIINVSDLNEAPIDLGLSTTTIDENSISNSLIGILYYVETDMNNICTFSLTSGDGDDDNQYFVISDNMLLITSSPDYESKSSYSIRVKTTDQDGLSFEKIIIITVNDLNEGVTSLSNANYLNKVEGIYPNPVIDVLTISLQNSEELNYTVSNIQGETMMQGLLNNSKTINVQDMNSGYYILKLNGHNYTNTYQFIKY